MTKIERKHGAWGLEVKGMTKI